MQVAEEGQRTVGIGERLGTGVGSHEFQTGLESTLNLYLHGVIAGLAEVFKAAIGVEAEELRMRTKRLTCSKSTRVAGIGNLDTRSGSLWRPDGSGQKSTLGGVIRRHGIDSIEARTQVGGVLTDIADTDDKIRTNLALDVDAPVLDHAGTTVFAVNVGRSGEVLLGGGEVWRLDVAGETIAEDKRAGETVAREAVRGNIAYDCIVIEFEVAAGACVAAWEVDLVSEVVADFDVVLAVKSINLHLDRNDIEFPALANISAGCATLWTAEHLDAWEDAELAARKTKNRNWVFFNVKR